MNKKIYKTPSIEIVQISTMSILTGSNTGARGEDVPWAARGRFIGEEPTDSPYDWDEDED